LGNCKWWKRSVRSYLFLFVLLPFVAVLIVYGAVVCLGLLEFTKFLAYVVVTGMFTAIAYYLWTIQSPRLWRAVWLLFGVIVIAFPLSVAVAFLLVKTLSPFVGRLHSFLLSLGTAILIGMLVACVCEKCEKLVSW